MWAKSNSLNILLAKGFQPAYNHLNQNITVLCTDKNDYTDIYTISTDVRSSV